MDRLISHPLNGLSRGMDGRNENTKQTLPSVSRTELITKWSFSLMYRMTKHLENRIK